MARVPVGRGSAMDVAWGGRPGPLSRWRIAATSSLLILLLSCGGPSSGTSTEALGGTSAPKVSSSPIATASSPEGTGTAAIPSIYPISAAPKGKPYQEWAQEWWQWAASLPLAGHPLAQSGDTDCSGGRRGLDVWFLGGTITSTNTLTRRCTIPPNTSLFFPVFNSECSTLEPAPFHGDDEASLRACATAYLGADLHVSLDGVDIPESTLQTFNITTAVFNINVPADNILSVPGPASGQSVGTGVHLFLTPLGPGLHALRFGGRAASADITIDVTYEITVAPE